jgi:predicted peptidase
MAGWMLAAGLLLSGLTQSAGEEDMGKQKALKFRPKGAKAEELQYLLYLPEGKEDKKGEKIPVMLFLHGAGERGSNIAKVTVHGPPKLIKQKKEFPFIVVSPQCPEGEIWKPDLLLQLIKEVIKKHNGDPERIYLTGLSMGGYGSWTLGLTHPEKFAAIAPICGGGNTIDILLPRPDKANALKTLPVWAFHGGKDDIVKLFESERMVETLKRSGNQAKLTIYPDAGHDSWTEAYNNPELYDWFLKQKRPGAGKFWENL